MRVILAEDSGLLRDALARLLTALQFDVIGQARDGDELLELVDRGVPDVVITDIRMPPTHTTEGIDAALRLRERHRGLPVLLLSQHVETTHSIRLLERGSSGIGYLLKDRVADAAELLDVLTRLQAGATVVDPEVVTRLLGRRASRDVLEDLTPRERDILALMAQGRSNGAIAAALHLAGKTVEAGIARIFAKLQLDAAPDDHRRVLAVLRWLQSGAESLPPRRA